MFEYVGWGTAVIALGVSFISIGLALFVREKAEAYRQGGLNQRVNDLEKNLTWQETKIKEVCSRLSEIEKNIVEIRVLIRKKEDKQ